MPEEKFYIVKFAIKGSTKPIERQTIACDPEEAKENIRASNRVNFIVDAWEDPNGIDDLLGLLEQLEATLW